MEMSSQEMDQLGSSKNTLHFSKRQTKQTVKLQRGKNTFNLSIEKSPNAENQLSNLSQMQIDLDEYQVIEVARSRQKLEDICENADNVDISYTSFEAAKGVVNGSDIVLVDRKLGFF